jgi:alpha-D-ribose 1-methylphosphonate 5-triphosphate synthase subunit PhnI
VILVGYSAARGGLDAILAAEELMRAKRDGGSSPPLGIDQVTERLNLAVDRVMGEAGLWAPRLAALALRQAEGDLIEAAHLLCAYRSTRMRLAQPVPVHADELEILRRIVPAYRVPPGPQLLGRTLDYVGRLLDTGTPRPATPGPEPAEPEGREAPEPPTAEAIPTQNGRPPRRLLDLLRSQGMIRDRRRPDDPEPYDVTRDPVRPGAPRLVRGAAPPRTPMPEPALRVTG